MSDCSLTSEQCVGYIMASSLASEQCVGYIMARTSYFRCGADDVNFVLDNMLSWKKRHFIIIFLHFVGKKVKIMTKIYTMKKNTKSQ
jgi:hypothetical protein